MADQDIRACLLTVIADHSPKWPERADLQSQPILRETMKRLGGGRDHDKEEALLTVFHDLFRTGYLAWGFDLANPNPPFFHTTAQGVRALSHLSRDPANPAGYFQHLSATVDLSPVTLTYVQEAVACFTHDLPKAAAVMLGCASESQLLDLRNALFERLKRTGRSVPAKLTDWRMKIMTEAVFAVLVQHAATMPQELRESLQSYWLAFLQQIRAARNDAGHPSAIDPVTFETVHASLLIFPELGAWLAAVRSWAQESL